ncbi:MAG: metallophosphoesterase family protein [Chitinophagaceae bacterium]|nr:metallophosphoesterase family protein [Chitinophagaceae bacterium]
MKNHFYTISTTLFCLASVLCIAQHKPYPEHATFPFAWNKPTPQPDRVVLTFSGNPATQQSVTWRTDTSVKKAVAQLSLAYEAPQLGKTAITIAGTTELLNGTKIRGTDLMANYHSATFTNLLPDTLYAYRVGDGTYWSEWFQFRTAAATPRPFSFLYVGDAQNYVLELWSRLVRAGFKKDPDARFIMHAGDLINNAHNDRQWHEWFSAQGWMAGMVPAVPVTGNHEYARHALSDTTNPLTNLSVQWRPQFTLPQNGIAQLPETNYTFDYQGVRFIVLNSNVLLEEQSAWLETQLANNPNTWTIVTHHHPVFSTAGERDNARLRNLWKPLYDKYKVDMVLQGHDHTYARGQAGATPKNEMKGVNSREPKAGTMYVVSVSGGKMYDLKKDIWKNYDAQLERGAENTQLFQVIQVDGNRLVYRAYTTSGALYDAFELRKSSKKGSPNRFKELKPGTEERRHSNTVPVY